MLGQALRPLRREVSSGSSHLLHRIATASSTAPRRLQSSATTKPSSSSTVVAPPASTGALAPEDAADAGTPIEVDQAPNRKGVWARSQQPRAKAMTGPRFEQTEFTLQVGVLLPGHIRRLKGLAPGEEASRSDRDQDGCLGSAETLLTSSCATPFVPYL